METDPQPHASLSAGLMSVLQHQSCPILHAWHPEHKHDLATGLRFLSVSQARGAVAAFHRLSHRMVWVGRGFKDHSVPARMAVALWARRGTRPWCAAAGGSVSLCTALGLSEILWCLG